jgi:hypothetical protein
VAEVSESALDDPAYVPEAGAVRGLEASAVGRDVDALFRAEMLRLELRYECKPTSSTTWSGLVT